MPDDRRNVQVCRDWPLWLRTTTARMHPSAERLTQDPRRRCKERTRLSFRVPEPCEGHGKHRDGGRVADTSPATAGLTSPATALTERTLVDITSTRP